MNNREHFEHQSEYVENHNGDTESQVDNPEIKRSLHLRGVMRSLTRTYELPEHIPHEILQRVADDYGLSPESLIKIGHANSLENPQQEAIWRTFFFVKRAMRNGVVDLHAIAANAHVPLSFARNVFESFGGDIDEVGQVKVEDKSKVATVGEPAPKGDGGIVWSWKSDEHRERMLELNERRAELQDPKNIDRLVQDVVESVGRGFWSGVEMDSNFPFPIDVVEIERKAHQTKYAVATKELHKVSFDTVVEYVIQHTQVDEFIDMDFVEAIAYRICGEIEKTFPSLNEYAQRQFEVELGNCPLRSSNTYGVEYKIIALKKYMIEYPEEYKKLRELHENLGLYEDDEHREDMVNSLGY